MFNRSQLKCKTKSFCQLDLELFLPIFFSPYKLKFDYKQINNEFIEYYTNNYFLLINRNQ